VKEGAVPGAVGSDQSSIFMSFGCALRGGTELGLPKFDIEDVQVGQADLNAGGECGSGLLRFARGDGGAKSSCFETPLRGSSA
jgi:hypothetical protein